MLPEVPFFLARHIKTADVVVRNPEPVALEIFLVGEILLVKIAVGVQDGPHLVVLFQEVQEILGVTAHLSLIHAFGILHIHHRGQIAGAEFHGAAEFEELILRADVGQKKMVGPPHDALPPRIVPIDVELRVFDPGAFGGLDEGKYDADIAYPHPFHPRPIHPPLPLAHIDAVYPIAVGNADAKLFVLLVVQRVLDERAHLVAHFRADDQHDDKQGQPDAAPAAQGQFFLIGIARREDA